MAVKPVQAKGKRKPAGKEKDYLAIARQKVTRPKLVTSFPKFLIYSRNKKGKTYFSLSAGIEKTLVIDPEDGTDRFKKLNPYVWPVKKWEDMQEVLGALRTGKLSPKLLGLGKSADPFEWVSCDGLTKINNMALKFVQRKSEEANLTQRPGFVDRSYYNKSGELMKEMLTQFQALKMGVVYTAQERIKTMDSSDAEDEDETVFIVPDVPDAVRGAANSIVDVIGRLYVVRVNLKSGGDRPQRRLWIGVHDRYDTGYRSDYERELPDFVKNPNIPKLTNLIHTGNEKGEAE